MKIKNSKKSTLGFEEFSTLIIGFLLGVSLILISFSGTSKDDLISKVILSDVSTILETMQSVESDISIIYPTDLRGSKIYVEGNKVILSRIGKPYAYDFISRNDNYDLNGLKTPTPLSHLTINSYIKSLYFGIYIKEFEKCNGKKFRDYPIVHFYTNNVKLEYNEMLTRQYYYRCLSKLNIKGENIVKEYPWNEFDNYKKTISSPLVKIIFEFDDTPSQDSELKSIEIYPYFYVDNHVSYYLEAMEVACIIKNSINLEDNRYNVIIFSPKSFNDLIEDRENKIQELTSSILIFIKIPSSREDINMIIDENNLFDNLCSKE